MSETLFRPAVGPLAPDTLVVSYYPLNGNDTNTGPRYQAEADITGFDVLGITRVGSNTPVRNSELRNELSVESFDKTWGAHTPDFDDITKDYDHVIVRGQSTGSFPSLAIVKNGLVRATHLLIEDGINMRRGRYNQSRNPLAARLDWLISDTQERIVKPQPPSADWVKPQGEKTKREPRILQTEIYHWSDLWRSKYSWRTSLDIVRTQPKLAIRFIFLGHTATGSLADQARFEDKLHQTKRSRVNDVNANKIAPVEWDKYPTYWHGFIEYPQFGAANLIATKKMHSFVTPQLS